VNITAQSTMAEVLRWHAGAQRALFRRYHIGGCSSCAFHEGETLAELCARNNNLDPSEVIRHLEASQQEDEQMLLSPRNVADRLARGEPLKLLDVRTREEWDAVRIEGAARMSRESMQDILAHWPREGLLIIYDHRGSSSLDAAAYFVGQGFTNVRALRGGIDAWAQEIDPRMPRYTLESASSAST
jgi:rhodanese-related sulfurtransferase